MSAAPDVPGSLGARVSEGIRTLTPGYFALTMASGIISTGLQFEGVPGVSAALLAVCALSYVVLVVLNFVRLVRYPEEMRRDFTDARRAFGFFTFIAGTDVLGVRLGTAGWPGATALLLGVAVVAWLVLGYLVPWTAVLGRDERPLLKDANGSWFVWCVATQSVALGAASVEPLAGPDPRAALALVAVAAWSVGLILYAAVGIFVSLRLMAYRILPEDLRPQYFVAMGAMAISVLAGARIAGLPDAPMVDATRGLVAGSSVVFWSFASWLLPVLLAAGWWRHVIHRAPLAYEAGLWIVIFPLGMYAVAGIYLGQVDRLPLVALIGRIGLWVALPAFLATFAGMTWHLWSTLVRPDDQLRRNTPG
ncbi:MULTISPECIES: tellurite resistance/C4-dicarboxylate transporter family protein [Arthrobacter]|uniref:Tellurite resistance protein permease n=1 Tax=Arthrobacter terricola TaxID=2547396 RepID=A0A4R5K670_9MICC|nr:MULTISPECIES: tellurite resistance/C4-dicarboxylate transporter family protein [Arthrobacter]MBT8163603.1 tellurite resistance/C4-dicarboxylate transporter family protein [Arthrobacter sp. GN70]TDF88544.1 tellurite resistance protein permease [Arthrobacter terricola]